jgi:hypothetical protein
LVVECGLDEVHKIDQPAVWLALVLNICTTL